MTKLPIGLQLYSVRDAMEKDFAGTIKAVAEMGYNQVEFAGLFGHSAEEVKAICAEAGVTPISAHVAPTVVLPDIEGVVKTYADIGCKYMVIPWMNGESLPGGPKYEQFLKDIRTIAAELKKYGMKLGYHNHDFEFAKVDGKYKLDILYADTTPDELQTQIDTCWANVGGENPAEYVKKYTGRAPLVHIKDFVGQKSNNMYGLIGGGKTEDNGAEPAEPFELRPVGYGVQDVAAIIAAAEAAGAESIIVEQDQPSLGKTPMECAKMSIDYIKSL